MKLLEYMRRVFTVRFGRTFGTFTFGGRVYER